MKYRATAVVVAVMLLSAAASTEVIAMAHESGTVVAVRTVDTTALGSLSVSQH